MQLNGIQIADRHNRPSVGSKVAIRTFFLNDGAYVDPYDISGVTIFSKLSNVTPASIIDSSNGIIQSDIDQAKVVMAYGVSGNPSEQVGGVPDGHNGTCTPGTTNCRVTSQRLDNAAWFPPYVPANNASGIYRVGAGDYVAVLDGTINLSGAYYLSENSFQVANTASSVQKYIDVWTVKLFQDSDWQVFINEFQLYNDSFLTLTEPLLLTPSNKLVNKHLTLGSKINLKVTTELTVNNKELSQEVKNIVEDFNISGATFSIQKVNEDSVNLPARVDVATTGGVLGDMIITSDNTMVAEFDTSLIDFGTSNLTAGVPGTYILTATYSFLNQKIVTKGFYFVIN
tara:strand:- start:65 stop:1090 length:1026 start_codon:yes stop_codon:yes gene_type:complete